MHHGRGRPIGGGGCVIENYSWRWSSADTNANADLLELEQVLCTHKLTCVFATPPNILKLISSLHASVNTVVTQPRPPANHWRNLLIEEPANATASCLIWIWILKHLPHYIFHYLINYSWNPQTSKGARMPGKHLDSPEPDSLFLLHNLQVYEPLPRLQVSPKDTQRRRRRREERGMSDRREGCHRQRDSVRGMVAEAEGDAERGGRWGKMRSGALGKGRRMEGRRNGKEGRRRHKEEERQTARQRANWVKATKATSSICDQ